MARDNKTRFRITTWPGVPLPNPATGSKRAADLTLGGALLADADGTSPDPVDHHEVYLEVCKLDLSQPSEILAFAQRYGHMGVMGDSIAHQAKGGSSSFWITKGIFGHPASMTVTREIDSEASDIAYELDRPTRARYLETLDGFRWGATCIRDLVRAWRFADEGLKPESWECPIWTALSDADIAAMRKPRREDGWRSDDWYLVKPPATPEDAAQLLSRVLSVGLDLFHPAVAVRPADHQADRLLPYEGRGATLYELCCLQLYNHMVEGATYRTCANESCGGLFVRQSGRAEHGQHRTKGVKYCTSECARAQAQREYRRRQRDT